MIVNVGWPRAATYGPLWQHRFAPLMLTAALLLAGAAVHRTMRGPRSAGETAGV